MRTSFRLVLAGLAACAFANPLFAQGQPGSPAVGAPAAAAEPRVFTPQPAETLGQTDGPWALAAIYGWVPGIKGTIGAGARSINVNQSVTDVAESAVSNLEGAATLHVEAGYGDVGIIFDLLYMKLVPLDGLFRAESRSTLFEAIGFYRVLNTGPGAGGVTFDVLAGTRYYNFRNSVQIAGLDLTTIERANNWFDVVVGARVGVQVCDSLKIFGRGDIGGFGIGESSQQACNLIAGFEYACSDCLSLYGGYRWFKLDRDQGSGRDRQVVDITLAGPFVAFGLHY